MRLCDVNDCYGCGACADICHKKCINLEYDKEGFLCPIIDESLCTNCGLCSNLCQKIQQKINADYSFDAFYGNLKDEILLKKSTSGGAFTALAENILSNNGLIYGAFFDLKNKKLYHIATTDLSKIRKSKYAQSDTSGTFGDVKKQLLNNRKIMYVGTPCQINALKLFLDKDYENLITVDFICHGTPPFPMLLEYIQSIEKRKKKIINFDCRSKRKGWSAALAELTWDDGKVSEINYGISTFFKAFSDNLNLKKKCYTCPFSDIHVSDITLADFWGYIYYDKTLAHEKGLSLILTNTEKGKKEVMNIKDEFILNSLQPEFTNYAIKKRSGNPYYNLEKRNDFFNEYIKTGYKKAMKRFLEKDILILKFKLKIIQLLKKFK